MTRPAIVKELLRLKGDDPLLPAEKVVQAARDPKSPLHDQFEWDDTEAAHQYRLWQARVLIANVRIIRDEKSEEPIPVFISLMDDRVKDGGGYRTLDEILRDPVQRRRLLATAISELKAFQDRYARLEELVDVFEAIKKTSKKNRVTA